MTPPIVFLILAATAFTSFVSGIFGMAGGLILMGVLTSTLPLAMAMVLHGFVQLIANGWRAFLLRRHISWSVFRRYLIGGAPAMLALGFIVWLPNKAFVFITLGLMAFMPWIPKKWFALDVNRPFQAEALGFLAQGLNTLAGVVGPILDVFFQKSDMTRQAIVATKGATQVVAHVTKIVFWSAPVIMGATGDGVLPPVWLLALAIPFSMMGTWAGGRVLAAMSDVSFRSYTRWILTVVGIVYLMRGFGVI